MRCPDERCDCGGVEESCCSCGGEGVHDAYEEDPLWYAPGETVRCATCMGRGLYVVCVRASDDSEAA